MCWRIFILSEEKPTIAKIQRTSFIWDNHISGLKVSDSSIQNYLKWIKWFTIPSQMCAQSYLYPIWPHNHQNLTKTPCKFDNTTSHLPLWLNSLVLTLISSCMHACRVFQILLGKWQESSKLYFSDTNL